MNGGRQSAEKHYSNEVRSLKILTLKLSEIKPNFSIDTEFGNDPFYLVVFELNKYNRNSDKVLYHVLRLFILSSIFFN